MSSTASPALAAQTSAPGFSQQVLNRLLDVHELYVKRKPGGKRAMIRYLQAPGLNLGGRALVEADFTGANFEGARMAGTNFERASLFCADLRGVDARGASFKRADIRGASLRHADLAGANLDEADMRQAMLGRMDLPEGFQLAGASAGQSPGSSDQAFSVDFTNCSMKGANLNNAKLKGANFTGALLHGADLKGAQLAGAVFAGAVLTGVSMTNVNIDSGALASCVVDPSAEALKRVRELMSRIEAAGRWVASRGQEGGPAVLDGEDLRPLAKAFACKGLTALSAKRARAIGVDFGGAQLQGAHFDGADLRDANFTGADLRGASFHGATLWHARFDKADMRPLSLASGVARAVNLQDALFSEACFRGAIVG